MIEPSDDELAQLPECSRQYIADLEQLVEEMQLSQDLRWRCDMRAIKLWQKQTGKELVWPDHADLTVWLINLLNQHGMLPDEKEINNANQIELTD